MNYKQITKEALEDSELYKTADLTDPALVDNLLQRFNAHFTLLSDMETEVSRMYDELVDKMEKDYCDNYKKYRNIMSIKDSEVEAKLDSFIEEEGKSPRKQKSDLKCSRDKSRKMLRGIERIIISLKTARKYNTSEITYGK